MAVVATGKPARTHYAIVERFGVATLLALPARDGPHAPDPRAPRFARASARRRSRVRPEGAARRSAGRRCTRRASRSCIRRPVARASGARRCLPISRSSWRRCARDEAPMTRRRTARSARASPPRDSTGSCPTWAGAADVGALVTTRNGGVSTGAYASMNLGAQRRRRRGRGRREPPAASRVPARRAALARADPRHRRRRRSTARRRDVPPPIADAAVTRERGVVCAVLVADCLPVLFADRAGTAVGIAHAGWRGLAAGVVERTVAALGRARRDARRPGRLARPGDRPRGVRSRRRGPRTRSSPTTRRADAHFAPRRAGKWHADLHALARRRLARVRRDARRRGGECTATDAARFYS